MTEILVFDKKLEILRVFKYLYITLKQKQQLVLFRT